MSWTLGCAMLSHKCDWMTFSHSVRSGFLDATGISYRHLLLSILNLNLKGSGVLPWLVNCLSKYGQIKRRNQIIKQLWPIKYSPWIIKNYDSKCDILLIQVQIKPNQLHWPKKHKNAIDRKKRGVLFGKIVSPLMQCWKHSQFFFGMCVSFYTKVAQLWIVTFSSAPNTFSSSQQKMIKTFPNYIYCFITSTEFDRNFS